LGKLIIWNLVTLDGYFEGKKSWDLDWHQRVWGDELENLSLEQLKSASTLLFGRVTYEGMAGYWSTQKGEIADYMNSIPKIVFSKTLEKANWNNSRLVKDRVEGEVSNLKLLNKDSFIFGSANLCSTLLERGLIDEIRLCVVPIILGGGNPLFKQNDQSMKLTLLETRQLKSGGVIMRYQPEKV
jgi:dihydrofolate reductase